MNIIIVGEADSLASTVAGYLTAWGHQVFSINPEQLPVQPDAESIVIFMPGLNLAQIENLVDRFSQPSGRLVYTSSMTVYRAWGRYTMQDSGPPDLVPLLETDPLLIGSEQALAEEFVQSVPIPATILRLPDVFGPGVSNIRIVDPLSAIDAGAPSISVGMLQSEWRLATAYVHDVAYAIALAAKNSKAAGRIYNVADSFAFTQVDWINAVGRAANWSGRVVLDPIMESAPVDYSQHMILDTSLIRRDLGYCEQTPINDAFRATVAWERSGKSTDQPY